MGCARQKLQGNGGMMAEKDQLEFAYMIAPGLQETGAVILARSIRDFGGRLARNRIRALVPRDIGAIRAKTREDLESLDVQIVPFAIEENPLKFPFAAKVHAAAAAESLAEGKSEILAWLDWDNIVIGEPSDILLPEGKALGYRPVMLKNISSVYDEPVDGFWQLVYQGCGTEATDAFPMATTVDNIPIRAQFNAGLLIARPRRGLLRAWRDNFVRLYRREEFQQFYRQNRLYAIFVHQAILAGTVLAALEPDEMQQLSNRYNYALMLRERMAEKDQDMKTIHPITLRYDEYQPNPDWLGKAGFDSPLRGWMDEMFGERPNADRPKGK
jgi:hypothetical protein